CRACSRACGCDEGSDHSYCPSVSCLSSMARSTVAFRVHSEAARERPAVGVIVEAAVRVAKAYPGTRRFGQRLLSIGGEFRQVPFVILVEPGVLTFCLGADAIHHLDGYTTGLVEAARVFLARFAVGRGNRADGHGERQADEHKSRP